MIIGIAGFKGSGKSVIAKAFADAGFVYMPFAGPLKAMLSTLVVMRGATKEQAYEMVYGNAKEEPTPFLDGKTPRWGMQSLGTEWGRGLMHPNIWTNAWMDAIKGANNVVVDDVRFANEVELIKTLRGEVIRVVRDGVYEAPEGSHPSEANASKLDVTGYVFNDGSLAELEATAAKTVRHYLKDRK